MWDTIGSLFTSILSGGMTGLFGIAVQRFADYKNKQLDIDAAKLKYAHEVDLRRVDAEIMAEEWAGRTRVADIEATGREAVASEASFAASFQMEPLRYSEAVKPSGGQSWVLVFLDFIRGIVRPMLTVYLCVLTTLVYFQARDLFNSSAMDSDPLEAVEILQQVVGTILYLTTTCVLWWFGTRNKQPAPKK